MVFRAKADFRAEAFREAVDSPLGVACRGAGSLGEGFQAADFLAPAMADILEPVGRAEAFRAIRGRARAIRLRPVR